MKKHIVPVCFLLLVLCSSYGVAGEIRIVTNQLPPLKYEKDGIAQGITVDILREIFAKIGKPFKLEDIQTMSWARAYEDTLTIPDTIILSIAMTEERKPLFKWVGPIYTIQLALIGKRRMGYEIEHAPDAARYKVGTLRHTAPEELLFKQGFPASAAYPIAKTEQALRMLKDNRIDLFAHTADSSFFMMPELGMDPSKYEVYYVIKDVDLYIGLNKSFSDEFVVEMQMALDALKESGPGGESPYDRIIGKYIQKR